jgi:NDP-sugar pyrophosphorylase family protein
MQAVILAAGQGKRLRPLTDDVPKPLVQVGGRPILEYTLSILPPEVDEVVLVVGYRGDAIRSHFGESFGRLKLSYIEQPLPLGTGEALQRARPLLKSESFLVVYADDLYHPSDLIECVSDGPSILVKESETPERFGVCLVDEGDRLLGILEKRPDPPTNLVNIGVYFLNHAIFDIPPMFSPSGENNLSEQIGALAEREPIRVVRARFWHPIGYIEDVERAGRWLEVGPDERSN